MRVHRLDEDFAKSRRRNWPTAFKGSLVLLVFIWTVFLLDSILPLDFRVLSLRPRESSGLLGILTSPLVHGDLAHLFSNSLPLLLASTALFGNYPKIATKAFSLCLFLTGTLVWLFARSSNHIGASGLLYSLLSFLFFSGFFKKDIQSIGISLAIAFMYGSLIFGVLPKDQSISWESHLFGFISGLSLAVLFRNKDMPVYKKWDFESE